MKGLLSKHCFVTAESKIFISPADCGVWTHPLFFTQIYAPGAVAGGMLQVSQVRQELQEPAALLVHRAIQDLPVLLGTWDLWVHRDNQDHQAQDLRDLQDLQAIQVGSGCIVQCRSGGFKPEGFVGH